MSTPETSEPTSPGLGGRPAGHLDQERAPLRVEATEGSRLQQLHASYAVAKSESAAAAERLKDITDAIKLELSQAAEAAGTEVTRVDLVGESGPALRLAYAERWTVDSRKLKALDPETWVRYARKSGAWSLSPIKVGVES